jgi:hypothetical protein
MYARGDHEGAEAELTSIGEEQLLLVVAEARDSAYDVLHSF